LYVLVKLVNTSVFSNIAISLMERKGAIQNARVVNEECE